MNIEWIFKNSEYWVNTCNRCCNECNKSNKECKNHCINVFVENCFCAGCKYKE